MIYTAFDHYMFSARALRGSIALYHTSHFRLPYLRKRLNLREDFSNATPERSSERRRSLREQKTRALCTQPQVASAAVPAVPVLDPARLEAVHA